MKLQFPFVQLPVRFDAQTLTAELAQLDESDWQPHPQGFAGNSALPLISVDGDPKNDGFTGPMRPTPFLDRFPYMRQVLGSLGMVLGRTRLMRLSAQAEVRPHIDQSYYWAERMRVHVPIVTQPAVRFYCADADIHMGAGECWIFDTWREHCVRNSGDATRIHLVADTVGGDGFWDLALGGRPHQTDAAGWTVNVIPPDPNATPELYFESTNTPRVMTPWEMHTHLAFLIGEWKPQPLNAEVQFHASRFMRAWKSLWTRYGDAREGFADYRIALDRFTEEMRRYQGRVTLRNELDFFAQLKALILLPALADRGKVEVSVELRESARAVSAAASPGIDRQFDRPVFIVSPPRSGSTLLFETLARARNVFTIGDESHVLIESIKQLRPVANDYASNRLDESAATPEVIEQLRQSFLDALVDRGGSKPTTIPLRMLEKTPKNSLRVPFLNTIFPEAQFVYLYRDPREVMASMIEAWNSGGFRTYPKLPGWEGLPWSLVLTPGWRELIGKPLHEIVASQWQAVTDILLDDLAALPTDRVHAVRYDALVADPDALVSILCRHLDFEWDQQLGQNLPNSRYTVSAPATDKWRRYQTEIDSLLPRLSKTIERARSVAGIR